MTPQDWPYPPPPAWAFPMCKRGPAPHHITSQFTVTWKGIEAAVLHCVDCDWYRIWAFGYGTAEGFGMPSARSQPFEIVARFARQVIKRFLKDPPIRERLVWTPE